MARAFVSQECVITETQGIFFPKSQLLNSFLIHDWLQAALNRCSHDHQTGGHFSSPPPISMKRKLGVYLFIG